ncbi:MAG: LacI family DNA-binding transcriptional regulator [Rubrobacter sp.]|nr:LacI family DNA-binding transcriptional regulator [Rubrobacter sp.]
MATIKDVAREAEVSVATVSRSFSGSQPVSAEVRERVREASRRLGYRPNAVARSLRVEATKTLGLVIPNITNPFFTEVARAVEAAAWVEGYGIMLGNTDEDPRKEERYLDVLLGKQIDGIIISPARSESPHLAEVEAAGVPVVFLDRAAAGVDAPVVRADGRLAVGAIVEYLANLGHERMAIISGPPETVSGEERLGTFLEEAERLGMEMPPEMVRTGDFRQESGERAMRDLLALEHPPTAVFAANNLMALGALTAARKAGVSIPAELSFASFDDSTWFELMRPSISAISQPIEELGGAAARTLVESLEGGRPASTTLAAELVLRESCTEPGRGR